MQFEEVEVSRFAGAVYSICLLDVPEHSFYLIDLVKIVLHVT